MAGPTFLHAADLHLGSPFRGLAGQGALPAVFADCTFDAFTRAIDLALAERVDGVLLAGDLYDQRDKSLRARLHLKEQLERLDAAGIPSFLVHGNHDPLDAAGPSHLPPSATVFGPTLTEVERDGYCVQGISFPTADVTENLSLRFQRRSDKPTVGLLHCNLGGQTGHRDHAPCTVADLERAGLDYWALGHVHTRAVFTLKGNARAAYPGNLQGRHVNEPGERGALLVTLGAPPVIRFVPLDTVRWHRADLPIDGLDAPEALVERAVARLGQVASSGPVAVRLQLTGRGPLHAQLGKRAELEDAIRARLGPHALLESVQDLTLPQWDLDRVVASGGLASEVALPIRTPATQSQLDALWTAAGLDQLDAALEEAGLAPLRSEAPGLLAEASTRAVDLLEGDLP